MPAVPNDPRGAQPGETGTTYPLGPTVRPHQRPGGIDGSASGRGDERDGIVDPFAEARAKGLVPPHTGY
jgi:hypothetical protein